MQPRLVGLQFTVLGLVWGASFLFMKVALEGLAPGQVAWGRLVLGALTLGVIVLVRRERLPRFGKVWAHMIVLAISYCIVPYLLFAWAQQHVASGLGAVYNATTPIMTVLIAGLAFRVEKLSRAQLAGVLAGILGVMIIIAPWQGLDFSQALLAQLALLGATASYGFSFGYMRRFLADTGVSALTFSFMNIGLGAVLALLLTPVIAVAPIELSWPVVLSMLALGCIGTGVAYIWNQNTVRAWGPTRASMVTYITPVVGVLLGILVLGETLHWNEPVGALVVFLGILLAQGRLTLRRRAQAAVPPAAP